MKSTKECKLPLSQLADNVREGHILSGLTHRSLIYTLKICDTGCKAIFDNTNTHIIKNEQLILTGTGYTKKVICRVPLKNLRNNQQIGKSQNIESTVHNT